MISKRLSKRTGRFALALAGVLSMAACVNTTSSVDREGIDFRQTRMAEVMAVRQWRECRDEAGTLDKKANQSSSPSGYLASANLLEKCESELGPNAAKGVKEERMRAYALSVQNHLKGGDISRAGTNLAKLKNAFPGKDLRYPDGSSFIATMELLLGKRDREEIGELAIINTNGAVKSELRRIRYWKHN